MCIDSLDRLEIIEFDYVIVAVNDKEMVNQIKERLLMKKIPEYKIISTPVYWG